MSSPKDLPVVELRWARSSAQQVAYLAQAITALLREWPTATIVISPPTILVGATLQSMQKRTLLLGPPVTEFELKELLSTVPSLLVSRAHN